MERSSGILMHISSLPSPYGIGTFGSDAYEFVDFLEKAGQEYWQILPLNPTSYGDSPYQSPSAFAGNPNFIDFDLLEKDGILEKKFYSDLQYGEDITKVDYGKIFENKLQILEIAFENSKDKYFEKIEAFKQQNKYWLDDYALYMAIKYENDLKPWHKWQREIKYREEKAISECYIKLERKVEFWIFVQYLFFKQWQDLKNYANNKNIKIIGDIPIYIAEDSADLWSKSENFLLDSEKRPTEVAGVPPDDFSDQGQYWGNPLYDWKYLKENGYIWWIERIKANLKLYDVVRLDHFRGFESYWAIKADSKTAVDGEWKKGPGIDIFDCFKQELGDLPLIIEDLGESTDNLIDFRKKVGYPPIKVLQFGFSTDSENMHLPHHYDTNWVAYTGTHDNNTVLGWLKTTDRKSLNYAKRYLSLNKEEGYTWGMIRGVWSSVASLSIAQMQDFLEIDSYGRMNSPNTQYDNWQWRIKKHQITEKLAERIRLLTQIYGRL